MADQERPVLIIDRDIERKFRIGKFHLEIRSRLSVTAGVFQDVSPDQPPSNEQPIKLVESSKDEVIEVPVEESTKVKVSR